MSIIVDGKKLPEPGDIIEITREVITGERRRNKPRGYDTFTIREKKTFRAVVRLGAFKEFAHVLHFITPTKESYLSYFYGSGRKSDIPRPIKLSLDDILKTTDIYKIVGDIDDNPLLLVEGYLEDV